MRPLVDFLNHGFLPFVGRSSQIERLLGFWRSTIDAHAIRVAMLLGEAGVGKSRLLEELMPMIAEEGGAVLHLKFYPGSNNPVAILFADALWRSMAARAVLKSEPQGNISSVGDALRRLARLRATVIVIEDLHLLQGDALGEFATLLAAVADEPISLICAARPVAVEARGLIEPYLIEEVELKGLTGEDLGTIWGTLFGGVGEPTVMTLLMEATRGNALAIRSALRGGVSGGALVQEPDGWSVHPPAFAGMLERNLELLSSGMSAHLNAQEREAAGRLASLGEVFAREAASAILDDAERMIDTLLFKGIVAVTSTPTTPLAGEASRRPLLAFTHTLTHRHFVGHAPIDAARLVGAVASGVPLYSILPFTLLVERSVIPATLGLDVVREAVRRSLKVNYALDLGSHWDLGAHAWRAAAFLVGSRMGEWEGVEWFRLLTELLYQRLAGLRRSVPEAWEPYVRHYLALTVDASSRREIEERVYALRFLTRLRWERDGIPCEEATAEVRKLALAHPWLRYTDAYSYNLGYRASLAMESGDLVEQRRIEREMEELTASEECPEPIRRALRGSVGRALLTLFESEEELARRMAQLDEMEAATGGDVLLRHLRISLLLQTGACRTMLDRCNELLPVLREQGLTRSYFDCRMLAICARAGLGEPLAPLMAEGARVCEELPAGLAGKLLPSLARMLVNTALLGGDADGALTVSERYLHDDQLPLTFYLPIVLRRSGGRFTPEDRAAIDVDHAELGRLLDLAVDDAADREALVTAVRSLLAERIYLVKHLLLLRSVLDLAIAVDARRGGDLLPELLPAITASLDRVLGWLDDRALPGWMEGLLGSYGEHMTPKSLERWRHRIAAHADAGGSDQERESRSDGTLRLSMLGTITATDARGEDQPVRGSRLRALLGLMVANQMQRKPLEREEFWLLAGGGTEDKTRSRKTMHQGVLRLRELLGRDAVLTDSDVPRLNLAIVEVDLLDAHRLLADASAAAREGALMRARPALASALDLVGSDVPFPALYEDFFEAAREEFESMLRATVIEVGCALLREGDAPGAAEIFGRGLKAIPEDEEMAAHLSSALREQGQHVEAQLTRLRVERSAYLL
jgi:DNA-binding SARP family transcriptional activator